MRLAALHPDWVLGFEDETWWSRLAHPTLHTWTAADHPLRLVEQSVAKDDPDPKALACYGVLLRWAEQAPEEVWLRFVDGRPVSALTIPFLEWCCQRLAARGKTALLLIWDNAPWHGSKAVRRWMRVHNRQVKQTGQGVRIVASSLPIKAPWLNPIEPRWVHSKRAVAEPDGLLTAQQLADRVCAYFDVPHDGHLTIPEQAA